VRWIGLKGPTLPLRPRIAPTLSLFFGAVTILVIELASWSRFKNVLVLILLEMIH
jgi:hypothetical protein